ncbi:MAG TPA: hypothetical protein VFQ45_13770 [Longimicrobium sp.]|nr:hypothetical protein [Longimicrobium sp.]
MALDPTGNGKQMETWAIVLVVVGVVVLVAALSVFFEDLVLMLLWIPPIVVVGGAVLYLRGEREWFTTLGTVLYFLAVLLCFPILVWLWKEIFDD